LSTNSKITVLVAPLDWGLGHSTRCIPLIKHLLLLGCKVIIAAEGLQKKLLKTEFPNVIFTDIPGYNVKYTKAKRFQSLKIAIQVPKILIIILSEKRWLDNFVKKNKVHAIISDNRFGLFHPKVTSVFITHQLLIKAPFSFLEKIIQKINYRYINRFSECWVPDEKGAVNLAGALSHPAKLPEIPVKYLGGISRLNQQHLDNEYDVLIILSGPEPQRTLLEEKVLAQLDHFTGRAMLLRGLPGAAEVLTAKGGVVIKNHLSAKDLEKVINQSDLVISRSGYTTVMDICKLQKKSVLIPTPGQTEQEYLALHLHQQGWCIAASQEEFSLVDSIAEAQNFNYRLPNLKMDSYKEVLSKFIQELESNIE